MSDGKNRRPAHRKPGRKLGRPKGSGSKYTEQIAADICAWIATGKTLREYCRQEGSPDASTVYDWRDQHPGFAQRFARAREQGHDAIAMECAAISDEGSEGNVQHRKLRIWTRLQLLARWDPKRYGERQQLEHSGGVSLQVVTGVPRE